MVTKQCENYHYPTAQKGRRQFSLQPLAFSG